jgi:hypothetical protein
LFRSLAYFRHYEDEDIRRDQKEGIAVYRPVDGLVVSNLTQGTKFILSDYSFQSFVKQEEIFIYCLSGLLSDHLRDKFGAVACVEIKDIRTFCNRIEAALSQATFPEMRGRMRIGSWVEYYDESEGGNPRWALPEKIATSKSRAYAWQNEFRLVFSLSDALSFENVNTQLVQRQSVELLPLAEHHSYAVKAQDLRDICQLHSF